MTSTIYNISYCLKVITRIRGAVLFFTVTVKWVELCCLRRPLKGRLWFVTVSHCQASLHRIQRPLKGTCDVVFYSHCQVSCIELYMKTLEKRLWFVIVSHCQASLIDLCKRMFLMSSIADKHCSSCKCLFQRHY